MDEKFIECCFNAQHDIFGFKLKPYSLSHLLVLEGRQNPLVTGEGRIKAPHLIDALAVCSRVQFPFRRNRVGIWDNLVSGAASHNVGIFSHGLKAFRDYQEDFVQVPEFWEDPAADGVTLSGPYVLAMAVSVMTTFPQLTEDRVWTMPIGLLCWYGAQATEFKQGRRFWSEEGEDEIEEGLRQAEAQITPEMRKFAQDRAAKIRAQRAGMTLPLNKAVPRG